MPKTCQSNKSNNATTGKRLAHGAGKSLWRICFQAAIVGCFVLAILTDPTWAAEKQRYQDRFVWIFGFNLNSANEVAEVVNLIDRAADSGYNGIVLSAGLDSLCKKSPKFLEHLALIKAKCDQNNLELIPSIFSVGYGGGVLAHNRYLAEGLPVRDALFVADKQTAHFVPETNARLINGGFEEYKGNRLVGYRFHDQPGEVSFIDTQVKHTGHASLRMENFTANPHGHGRVMQEVSVQPYRCYRVSLWVKTENLSPPSAFRTLVLAENRTLAPISFNIPATSDWRKITFIFNSLKYDKVRLYAGVWGGKSGKFWLDDWSVEEVGPINVLRRPGTPVVVRNEDGSIIYEEGRDYEPLVDPHYSPYRPDHDAPVLRLTANSRIRPGQRLRVSWYHSQVIHSSQITVCMAEPELYEIFDHEAALLAKYLKPKRVLLSMDEIRMGGTCAACQGKNMAQLLGQCITRQVQILRKHLPGVQVYIWSDMLDPNHNAHGNYYLVDGDFSGSWNYVPKDLIIAVWGGKPRKESLEFFHQQGFRMLVACYYDADNLTDVNGWLSLTDNLPTVTGYMYTTWRRKYDLLEKFGQLLQEPSP